jgi:hypothetical protein
VVSISHTRLQNKSPPEAFIATLKAEKAAGKVYFEWSRDLASHINIFFVADMRLVGFAPLRRAKYLNILLL